MTYAYFHPRDWKLLLPHENDMEGVLPVLAGGNDRSATYRLVDLFSAGSLWDRRNDPQTYAAWGTFAGDNGEDNAAHAPWAWDDLDDGSDLQPGSIATDPAYLVSRYFGNTGSFSLTYLPDGSIGFARAALG